jgi:hypothetical protein
MNRYLRTEVQKNTKDGAEPKLRAGELRRDKRKVNRLKGEKAI